LVAVVATGVLILAIQLLSGFIRLWQAFVVEPLTAMLLGVVLGPAVLDLVDPGPLAGQGARLLEGAARVALAFGLLRLGMRLPRGAIRRQARTLTGLLGGVLPLTWLVTALLLWLLLPLPGAEALVLGAALAPTDPVVANTIIGGPIAERLVPGRLRRAVAGESGLNDGLASPLIALVVALGATSPGHALGGWLLRDVLLAVGGGLVAGALAGTVTGWLVCLGRRSEPKVATAHLVTALALAVALTPTCELLHLNGLLAVFAAGIAYDAAAGESDEATERAQEGLDPFFTIPVFVLLGASLPWSSWGLLGWRAGAVVVVALALRRLPATLALRRLVPAIETGRDALFVGWFGPIGVAAVLYGAEAAHRDPDSLAWPVVSLAIAASVVVHGVSAPWLTRAYAGAASHGTPHPAAA
jgi:NhaP-type Na+/H+ or K+/H+ antiporter